MKTNPYLRGMAPMGARHALMNRVHLAKIDSTARFKRYSMRAFNVPGWSHWGRHLSPISYRIGRRKELAPAKWRAIIYRECPL
jgi:hypothetical protein